MTTEEDNKKIAEEKRVQLKKELDAMYKISDILLDFDEDTAERVLQWVMTTVKAKRSVLPLQDVVVPWTRTPQPNERFVSIYACPPSSGWNPLDDDLNGEHTFTSDGFYVDDGITCSGIVVTTENEDPHPPLPKSKK